MGLLVQRPNDISVRDEIARSIVHKMVAAYKHIPLEAPPLPEGFFAAQVRDTAGFDEGVQEAPDKPLVQFPICIIGAGCAGLYAAMILDTLHIPYEILEASDRIGGRLFTHRFNGEVGRDAPVNTPARYDYIDMGGMRFPHMSFMDRVFDLFKRVKMQHLLIPYKFKAENQLGLFNGVRHNSSDRVPTTTDVYNVGIESGGAIPPEFWQRGPTEIVQSVFEPFAARFRVDFDDGWEFLSQYDHMSTRAYMVSVMKFPEAVVDWLETFEMGTGMYDDSFVESVMDAMEFGTVSPEKGGKLMEEAEGYEWSCIDGGSDHLPTRMAESINNTPRMGVRVTAIASTKDGQAMEVEFRTSDGKTEKQTYSQVISTVPLGCLSAINIPTNDLSYMKRMAIRSLRYDTSTKIALKFTKRWWEDPAIMGDRTIQGGISSTDLPIRTCVYPSYGFACGEEAPGVLLASYTWSQDAQRLGGLASHPKGSESNQLLVELTLQNLADLHGIPLDIIAPLLQDHFAWNWHNDQNARGAFALFGPGQFGDPYEGNSMFVSLKSPGAGGRLHIAGEATSVHHAWVLGALNSAWRAVYNALGMLPPLQVPVMRKALEDEWLTPDEVFPDELDRLAAIALDPSNTV